MAKIYIPILNPLRFVDESFENLPQYATKQFDDFLFEEQLQAWEEPVEYCQKYSTTDIIKLQFQADFDPIKVNVVDADDNIVLTFAAAWTLRNKYDPTFFIYEVSINLNSLPTGCYRVKLECGGGGLLPPDKTLISESFEVIEDISNTILFEYNNSTFFGNVLFETGITFGFRVEGIINKMQPKSKDVLYEDQVLNQTLLSGRPYRLFKLGIGGTFGVPEWIIDKLNWIMDCNNIAIDGKYFTKSEGATWNPKEEENYPLRGYDIDIRESLRRDSAIFDLTVNSNKQLLLIGNIDSKGFGDTYSAASNVIQVISLE